MFTRPQGIALKNRSQEACGRGLASRLAGPAGRRITRAAIQTPSKLLCTPKVAALGVSLAPCANASFVGILGGARLSFPAYRSLAGSPNAGAWAPSEVVPAIQSWTLRQANPRAPPV